MANGNSELRAELYRLTLPPEGADCGWLDVQVREMQALNERIPHSVRLHRRFSPPIYEVNCFMFALGIEADAVSDMRLGPVFPGKQFVESLLANGDLREVEGEGPIVIYLRDGAPEHAGRWGGTAVISKWGGRRDPHLATCLVGCAGILRRRRTLLRGVADRRRALPALGRGPRPLSDSRGVHIQYYSAQIDA
jgi:hypothetical protein